MKHLLSVLILFSFMSVASTEGGEKIGFRCTKQKVIDVNTKETTLIHYDLTVTGNLKDGIIIGAVTSEHLYCKDATYTDIQLNIVCSISRKMAYVNNIVSKITIDRYSGSYEEIMSFDTNKGIRFYGECDVRNYRYPGPNQY